jgi:hypothetical protein
LVVQPEVRRARVRKPRPPVVRRPLPVQPHGRRGCWQSDTTTRTRSHAAEAAQLAEQGLPVADIADRLHLTIPAAAALLRLAHTTHAA